MRKIKKFNFPSNKEFMNNFKVGARILYYLGIIQLKNKRLAGRREFIADVKPVYWNPLFYVAWTMMFAVFMFAVILTSIVKALTESHEVFCGQQARVDFDEKYVTEFEELTTE